MDNKLSELSKPVAWILHTRGGDVPTLDECYVANAEGMENIRSSALYSQEYVSALLAELDGMVQTLNVANDATRIWKERALAAEAKLATPVRSPDDGLDDCCDMWPQDCSDDFDTGYKFGLWRYEQNICAAGFTVEGDE